MNVPTIIGVVIVAAILAAILIRAVHNRKNGKSSCGCGCENCPNSGACHPKN